MAACVAAQVGGSRAAPEYTLEGVFDAASFQPRFSPGMLVSISGSNLSWTERWRSDGDVRGSVLPSTLPETMVTVTVAGQPAAIEYASPGQVLFLLPPGLKPGPVTVRLAVAGLAGPKVVLPVTELAPALFQLGEQFAMARRADTMEFVSGPEPARGGVAIILYGSGLGATTPAQKPMVLPRAEAAIKHRESLRVLLDGEALPDDSIGYAGVMPGYPGFYEIRLRLPASVPEDPEVQVCLAGECSPGGLRLRTKVVETNPPPAQPEETPPRSDN
jgi:uncharacterized protein (TIGR03437 family)